MLRPNGFQRSCILDTVQFWIALGKTVTNAVSSYYDSNYIAREKPWLSTFVTVLGNLEKAICSAWVDARDGLDVLLPTFKQ